MPILRYDTFQEFSYGYTSGQRIDFDIDIDDHRLVMFFMPASEFYDDERKEEISRALTAPFPENSYDIKFDRLENFETENYYQPPDTQYSKANYRFMTRLSRGIAQLIDYHCEEVQPEAYFAVAENHRLKRFYDRLAVKHAPGLNFNPINGIGHEGLGYALTTRHYTG